MADYPFVIAQNVTIAAGNTGTATFQLGASESFSIHRILGDLDTAGVNIVNIRDQGGRGYMPPGTAGNIPVKQIGNPAHGNELNALEFVTPLELPAQGSLLIDVQNTTAGSITIDLQAVGVKHIGT